MAARIIGIGVTGLVGIVLIVLGWQIWRHEKINLLHDYHIDKVSLENRAPFCKLSGIGVLSMGISLLLTTAVLIITDSAWSFIIFSVGFIGGILMLIVAGMKYNH